MVECILLVFSIRDFMLPYSDFCICNNVFVFRAKITMSADQTMFVCYHPAKPFPLQFSKVRYLSVSLFLIPLFSLVGWVLPIVDYIGLRLCLKGVLFSSCRYIKG